MKKKVLLSSIATIALCLCLIAGSTFALFTSTTNVNVAVTAANVEMLAALENLEIYSVKATVGGSIVDEQGGTYEYEGPLSGFTNGGTAVIDGSILTLDKVTPGDKVAFDVTGTNSSDVAIQYRYVVECVSGEKLMSGLLVSINETTYPVLSSYTSEWFTLQPGSNIETVSIVVELPVDAGNEYKKQTTEIKVTVEAVQGNADVEGSEPVVKFLDGSNATMVSDLASLQAALDNAVEGENIIVLAADIAGDVVATQKANVKTTIEGNGHTFAGVINVDGKSATYTSAALTIKNLIFKADSISADACIRLGNGTNATRYTCNVTVENCTFDVPGAVGVKSYTGGDKNVSVINCVATANAHSLVQLKGVDGALVLACEVYSKNGLNFNNSTNVIVNKCTVDVSGYAVRFGESSGGTGAAEVYTIKNSSLKSANADGDATIILRGTADYSTLTIVNTTIVGTPDIANTAIGATVVQ